MKELISPLKYYLRGIHQFFNLFYIIDVWVIVLILKLNKRVRNSLGIKPKKSKYETKVRNSKLYGEIRYFISKIDNWLPVIVI